MSKGFDRLVWLNIGETLDGVYAPFTRETHLFFQKATNGNNGGGGIARKKREQHITVFFEARQKAEGGIAREQGQLEGSFLFEVITFLG